MLMSLLIAEFEPFITDAQTINIPFTNNRLLRILSMKPESMIFLSLLFILKSVDQLKREQI